MRGAADIALMGARNRPEQPPCAVEDRHEHGDVRQMAAAMIGIVHEDHVARRHLRKALVDGARGPGQRADMNRNVIGLRNQPALDVADREREIAA